MRDGKGVMVDWRYADGADYLPSDDEVRALRPAPERRRRARTPPRHGQLALARLGG